MKRTIEAGRAGEYDDRGWINTEDERMSEAGATFTPDMRKLVKSLAGRKKDISVAAREAIDTLLAAYDAQQDELARLRNSNARLRSANEHLAARNAALADREPRAEGET